MLNRFPLKLDVQFVRLCKIKFFLSDLFSGRAGRVERGGHGKAIPISELQASVTVALIGCYDQHHRHRPVGLL